MSIVKTRSKSVLFVLLLTFMASQHVHAERKLYSSGNNAPFIRMMLSMMDAMGMIDRVPGNGIYGGGYGNNFLSPLSNASNPYARALALRGVYPGASSLYSNPYSNNLLANNPFSSSPWLQSPWMNSADNGLYGSSYASPLWGSPDWGVLPAEKYAPGSYGQLWSETDLDGWVDEPWETSEWNPNAEKSSNSSQPTRTYQQSRSQLVQPNVPLIQNFNITIPDTSQRSSSQDTEADNGQNQRYPDEYNNTYSDANNNRSPLARLYQSGQPRQQSNRAPVQQRKPSPLHKRVMPQQGSQPSRAQQSRAQPFTEQQAMEYQARERQAKEYQAREQRAREHQARQQAQEQQARDQQLRQSQQREPQARNQSQLPRNQIRERPCISEFCGLKKPDLNGLWVAQDGEMLGISGEKFLWADTNERYLSGRLKIENEYLLASVEGSDRLMRFKYKIAGDHLLTMQPNGTIREFIRTTPGELYGGYYGGY